MLKLNYKIGQTVFCTLTETDIQISKHVLEYTVNSFTISVRFKQRLCIS